MGLDDDVIGHGVGVVVSVHRRQIYVGVKPYRNGALIIQVQSLLATEVEVTADLLWHLMQINRNEAVGQLSVDEQGKLFASIALLDEGCTKDVLKRAVETLARLAREHASTPVARWGGSLHSYKENTAP